jgi:hypothetical protein
VWRAITAHDTEKCGVPEKEAWFSLRLCQQPPAAGAAKAPILSRPEGAIKARAFAGRDSGAAAVMEKRCDKGTPATHHS